MLTQRRINFLESIPGWKEFAAAESSAICRQKLLLDMARNGEERPAVLASPLGWALSHYTTGDRIQKYPQFNIDIRDAAPRWFDTVAINMAKLLDMARNGEDRPNYKTPLGVALSVYIKGKYIQKYPQFNIDIREAAPQWFEDTVAINMAKLIDMARNGEDRPSTKTTLGSALCRYTTGKGSKKYNQFNIDIRTAAPHWFEDTVAANMAKLIEMARNGEGRPPQTKLNKLGKQLCRYTNQVGQKLYREFNIQIRNIAPQWFEDTVAINLAQLIEMAHNGEERPKYGTPLGTVLSRYTTVKYCMEKYSQFNKEIRSAAPQWFEDVVSIKKAELLKMARNGEDKPKQNTPLGLALSHYMYGRDAKKHSAFCEEIRELAPHWFEDTVAINMAELIEMARNGESRPPQTSKLGTVLGNYTRTSCNRKHQKFNEEIRKLAPHWFKSRRSSEELAECVP